MSKILVLTLRSKIRGVKRDEWMGVLEEDVRFREQYVEREVDEISANASDKSVCVGASQDVGSNLERRGFKVRLVELDRSYSPLDVLREMISRSRLSGEKLSEETIERLLRFQLQFTDMIIASHSFEEGYHRWMKRYSQKIDDLRFEQNALA